MSGLEAFGTTADGELVSRVHIRGDGLTASIMNWGAAVQDLRIEGHEAPLVLGFERFEDYPAHAPYFGLTAGRYANRIRDGRFTLDGVTHQLDTNFLGKHHLHGGAAGIGKRVWRFVDVGRDHVMLALTDRDGAMGYPGTVEIEAQFRLADGALQITYEATTDRATLVNLAHHSYFNLEDGGAGSILGHRLTIPAESYIPVDEELIPTGEVASVIGTEFDFRTPRRIANTGGGTQTIYDHNWCLADRRRTELALCARLEAERSGLAMEVWSGEPGIQFYAGHKLAPQPTGLSGIRYNAYAGLCLEPQVWPDSPNHAYFPQAILRTGETYLQRTQYRFSRMPG
jgi:aldose 1-epimerase